MDDDAAGSASSRQDAESDGAAASTPGQTLIAAPEDNADEHTVETGDMNVGGDAEMDVDHDAKARRNDTFQHFDDYLNDHQSIDGYQAKLKALYSPEYHAIIDEHIVSLQASMDTDETQGPERTLLSFLHSCNALSKRKEAVLAQQNLL
jgi:hypothetical protein